MNCIYGQTYHKFMHNYLFTNKGIVTFWKWQNCCVDLFIMCDIVKEWSWGMAEGDESGSRANTNTMIYLLNLREWRMNVNCGINVWRFNSNSHICSDQDKCDYCDRLMIPNDVDHICRWVVIKFSERGICYDLKQENTANFRNRIFVYWIFFIQRNCVYKNN